MAGQGASIRLPVDIWGFPGGQAFLAGVPAVVVESQIGMIASLPECTFDSYFLDVGQATKNALMADTSVKNAEFGPRAAQDPDLVIGTTWNRYVGSGGRTRLSSSDMSEFVHPDLSLACGTIGHEQLSAHMRLDRSLQESQRSAFRAILTKKGAATLLLDLIDTLTIGMEDFLLMMEEFKDAKIGGRVDSGNIKHQCVVLDQVTRSFGHGNAPIVFEDEVTPVLAREVLEHVKEETGTDASRFIPGAGGYHYKLTRDDLSAKYARTMTGDQPNMKFGNAGEAGGQESTMVSGKQSIPGWIRVYGQGDTMIVADKSEKIDGEPLFVQLVKNGRICYCEFMDAQAQAKRCLATRGRYKNKRLSPLLADWVGRYTSMRKTEVAAARARLEAKGVKFDAE
jgi:nicotinic acid phosphoribosyltransferase